MNTQDALNIYDEIAASVQMSRKDHETVRQAYRVLSVMIEDATPPVAAGEQTEEEA